MAQEKYTVAVIGGGRLGQHYIEVYQTLPNTEVVAVAEINEERRRAVGERFGIKGLYKDAEDLFRHVSPDISAVVLPGGDLRGASVHSWGGEISGGGCQHIAVLRLLAGAEVSEVIAWGKPEEALKSDNDEGLIINGFFRLSNGLDCPVFGEQTPYRGVDVWTDDALLRWDWAPPEIYQGFDAVGARLKVERAYTPLQYPHFTYMGTSIMSFLDVVENGGELFVSGHDLRQSLEVAIAAKHSALWGSVPLKLPLEDRSLTLYPRAYRWLGGDQSGSRQTYQEVLDYELFA